jgi:hypothetical protein
VTKQEKFMRVSGYTFIRNGTRLSYPFVESIRSILPIVDEYVVAVGAGEDDTLDRVRAIGDPKIRIVETRWNENMRVKGFTYAQQKMIAQYNCTGDWAFYLEGDEIVHERDLAAIRTSMECHLGDPRVEALVFDYHHFWGRPDQLIQGHGWYRLAPRIIRNTIRSYTADALFFLILEKNKRGRYPRAVHSGARIFHYGYVRPTASYVEKRQQTGNFWGSIRAFRGYGAVDPQRLAPFTGEHPAVIKDWLRTVAQQEFALDPDYRPSFRDRRHRLATVIEKSLGIVIEKKHYKLIR